jgi:hypothetical protein
MYKYVWVRGYGFTLPHSGIVSWSGKEKQTEFIVPIARRFFQRWILRWVDDEGRVRPDRGIVRAQSARLHMQADRHPAKKG